MQRIILEIYPYLTQPSPYKGEEVFYEIPSLARRGMGRFYA
jgi:hypothetical protein